jgi:cytochrome d ubiquinol oxidase subunit II
MASPNLLPEVWYGVLGLLLYLMVAADGLTLGVGLLSLGRRDEGERAQMIEAIAGVWHANQTWLVVLGAGLFGAFPGVYGLVLPALYVPLGGMLLGLLLRGLGLEWYYEARKKRWPALAWGWGSLLAALSQGLAVGGYLSGLRVKDGRFAGSLWDWLGSYGLTVAVGLVLVYLLLGSTYLVLRAQGDLQARARRQALVAAVLALAAAGSACAWTLLRYPALGQKMVAWPSLLLTSLPLVLAAAVALALLASLWFGLRLFPFLLTLKLVGLIVLSGAASLFPTVVWPGLTAAQAAAPAPTLVVMLLGLGLLLPLMLGYNAYQYLVFARPAGGER